MKILNTFISSNFCADFKKKQSLNLFPLQSDSVSFTGKKTDDEISSDYYDGISFELIDDSNLRDLIKTIVQSTGYNTTVTRGEFLAVISYFGYERGQDSGDHQTYCRNKKNLPKGNFRTAIKPKDKSIDHALVAELRYALRRANECNGELYMDNGGRVKPEDFYESVIENSKIYNPKGDTNKYRRALAKARAEQASKNSSSEAIDTASKEDEINKAKQKQLDGSIKGAIMVVDVKLKEIYDLLYQEKSDAKAYAEELPKIATNLPDKAKEIDQIIFEVNEF